ncbi:hypothetical protein IL306_003619 [Fusarium sp. DS 682]|nr:hypothetical protein IL306_003619 [Fusarium sp. DS 682]
MSRPTLYSNGTLKSNDSGQTGRYHIESLRQCEVVSGGGKVTTKDWQDFKTGPLSEDLIKRIRHLQLITESKDQRVADDPREGNWSWFELGIVKSQSSTTNTKEALRWMSHENAFMTQEFEWREGKVFSHGDALLKSLQADDDVQVRLCSRFGAWGILAKKGYLVFAIGDEGVPRTPVVLPQADMRAYMSIVGADQVAELLSEYDRRLKVRCESDPSAELLIRRETSYDTPQAQPNSYPAIPHERQLVVLDADDLPWRKIDRNIDKRRRLSWDQTVENFWKLEGELQFIYSYHLLIRFGYEGAIYRDPAMRQSLVLIFEPRSAEGCFVKTCENPATLKQALDTAFMAGLAASLAKESHLSIKRLCETQIKQAVITGLQ